MGKRLKLNPPVTYNEKLQWLKLYDRAPRYTQMVDKYEVRKYIADKIGEEYLIPLLGVWDRFDDIDFDKLPDQFVLKCTHDSGSVFICKEKNDCNIKAAKKKISKSLKKNYYHHYREWPYKNIKPRVIAEQFMVDESGIELKDYKFFCFDGVPKMLFIASDRPHDTRFDFYDIEFNHLPFEQGHPWATKQINKPEDFNEMLEIAAELSQNIPHVRVDLYDINGKIYFGELTFTHYSGSVPFRPEVWDTKIGNWLKLPIMKYESKAMKKRLLFAIPYLGGGGAERMFLNLCNNLDRNRFEIILCLFKAKGEYLSLLKKDVKVIDLNSVQLRNSIMRIRKTIKKEKPDMVISSISYVNILLATSRFLLPKRNIRYIARESNMLSEVMKNASYIMRFLQKYYKNMDYIIAQSDDMKKDLVMNCSIPENKITIINNFIDIDYINKKLNENINVELPDNKINLLSIGKFEYQKGYDMLLKSFSNFKYIDKFHLTIIGQGTLKQEIQQQIINLGLESRVSLCGFTHNPYKYMERADIFVSSSRYEGFPNVVIESLCCGLPVIANNYKGGINEILRYSEFGNIIDIQNTKEFEETICNVLKKDRTIIKNKAIELYSKTKIIKQYEHFFTNIS
jgi:glycosyltransferase involved in cell wall biosynthesis